MFNCFHRRYRYDVILCFLIIERHGIEIKLVFFDFAIPDAIVYIENLLRVIRLDMKCQ